MSKHWDCWLNAKVWQTIVPLFVGLFIYFWLFSARICHIKSLEGECLHSACWGNSINSLLMLLQTFAHGLQKSWWCKCVECVFNDSILVQFSFIIRVFFSTQRFIDRFLSFLNALGAVTVRPPAPVDSGDKNFGGPSRLSHSVCVGTA